VPTHTATPLPTATPTALSVSAGPANQPLGFPLDAGLRTGMVTGEVGSRTIAWGEGAAVLAYSRDDQVSSDPVRANRCGWNARTHVEYEGQPAVDWYIPLDTPVRATMDGTATLLVNTTSNPFDVYGVSREPYIGNPDRSRAPVSPFAGPGGGQGTFVRIESDAYRADHAHLHLAHTLTLVPKDAFLPGYDASFDFATTFAALRDFRIATAVARWSVRRGEVIGFSGDSGYSEAPHLHYAISRLGDANNLCPTTEAGFSDSGWLLK
jgi:murein DD-endopeptidase MepM/ murein hydrolase activator NlpD